MKSFAILCSGFLVASSLYAMQGLDTLSSLCVKKLEQQGVQEFVNQLHALDEHQSFEALCVSLLKSDTFTVDQKLELVDLINTDPNDVNMSYDSMSDIDMQSDPDTYMTDNTSRFHSNCYKDMVQVITAMFQYREKTTVNTPGFDDRTLLHITATGTDFSYQNKRSLVKLLLSMGASCLARDIHGCTPLHDAVSSLSVGAVQDILESKDGLQAVHIGDAKGHTPLHMIVSTVSDAPATYNRENSKNIAQIIELLCKCGANISAKDRLQESPLSIAQAFDMKTKGDLATLLQTYSKTRN